jgi:Spy/CpxP family protein refolding chaperone
MSKSNKGYEFTVIIMRNLMLTLIAIFFSLAVTADLSAMDGASRRGFGPSEAAAYQNREKVFELLISLNLAPEQKATIKALRDAHQAEIKPLQSQMFRVSGDLKLLWLQSTTNKEQILAKHKEIRAIREQIRDKLSRYRLEVFNALTPEQQEKAKTFFAEAWAGHDLKSGMGPGAGMMGR